MVTNTSFVKHKVTKSGSIFYLPPQMSEKEVFGNTLRSLRERSGKSQQDIADLLVVSRNAISGFEKGKSFPVPDKLVKLARYFQVTVDYLLTGEAPPPGTNTSQTENPTTPYRAGAPVPGDVLVVTVDNAGRENIVMVGTQAGASYPTRYLEPEFYQQLPAFSIPLPQFRNATFRAFQVKGDSMRRTFHDGSWVFARRLDWPREALQEGYVHVVVARDALVVKRVLDRSKERGTLSLQSDNEDYDTFEVPIEDVLELWRVVGGLNFQFPNVRHDLSKELQQLRTDVAYLLSRDNSTRDK